jgi:lipopolysaccharide export system protein LptC
MKIAAIALVAALLVLNPGEWLGFSTQFILLGMLLIGGVIWMMPHEEQEAEEREREANEARWQREQAEAARADEQRPESPEGTHDEPR